jgi:hypothetical protein
VEPSSVVTPGAPGHIGEYMVRTTEDTKFKFDEIATQLCDRAHDLGMKFPYELEFYDETGIVARFDLDKDGITDLGWLWTPGWMSGWSFEGPIKAVLKSGDQKLYETFTME